MCLVLSYLIVKTENSKDVINLTFLAVFGCHYRELFAHHKKNHSVTKKGPISLRKILVGNKGMPWRKQAKSLLKAGHGFGALPRMCYHLFARSVVRVTPTSLLSRLLSPSRSSPTDTVICLRLALTELSSTLHRYEPSIEELVSANVLE